MARPETPSVPYRPRGLLAEDKPSLRELLPAMMAPLQIDWTLVNSGKAAYEAVRDSPKKFDIYFTDIQMPDWNGDVFLDAVRNGVEIEGEQYPPVDGVVPAIACSGNWNEKSGATLRRLGVAIVQKPVSIETLFREVPLVLVRSPNPEIKGYMEVMRPYVDQLIQRYAGLRS